MSTAPDNADRTPSQRYTASLANEIESRWQHVWETQETFRQPNPGEQGFDASKPKFYCLDMFPYPSGAGLHVGHPEGYTATDIICRFKRMRGFNVLHPMGWDAFGLPAEQYAIQTGVHPAVTTTQAIDNFRRQLKRFGFSYDWAREFGTIDEDYYRWTQWIFLRIYNAWYDTRVQKARPISDLVEALERGELAVTFAGDIVTPDTRSGLGAIGGSPVGLRQWHKLTADERREVIDAQRLAYLGEQTVNWCPKLGTVLANDEVIDGRSERGGYPVLRKPLRQWMFRITVYAERLLEGLKKVDWPSSTRTMQEEWIGRSEGAEIGFEVDPSSTIAVFTTRPDTIFGATYMVLAPEHPLVEDILAKPHPETDTAALREYVNWARNRSDVERQESKDKTGVFTGAYAVNPATGERIPVWVADYVLMGYGFGAIMAVPAHDERDFEFARKFNLPIRVVVRPDSGEVHLDAPAAFWDRVAEAFGDAGYYSAVWVPGAHGRGVVDEMFDKLASVPDVRSLIQVHDLGTDGWCLLVRKPLDDIVIAHLPSPVAQIALGEPWPDPGVALHSHNAEVSLDGLPTPEAKRTVIQWLESSGTGRRKVNYRLRDWLFSRQRYWGEPFPIVFDREGRHHPVGEHTLPVRLPELADYAPIESDDPQPLLAKATDWVRTTAAEAGVTTLPPETPLVRETNTMPGSAGSSWYFLRYCDAGNAIRFASREAEQYWMGGDAAGGVDLYLGGSEHAVGHLLYSRFWQNVLFDLGEVSTPEPFQKLFHQGMITSYAYQRADKSIVPTDEVDEVREGEFAFRSTGEKVTPVVTKMSKRYKNVINPDDVIAEFGADTFRLYEMYMGPLEASKPWNTKDIHGLHRFLQRLWRVVINEDSGDVIVGDADDTNLEKLLHRLIAKVAADIDRLAFNTAIASMIEFVNAATSQREKGGTPISRSQAKRLTLVVAPFAPHIAEELWQRLGAEGLASLQPWPAHDEALLRDDSVEIAIQIQGKVRHRMHVPTGGDPKAIETLVLAEPAVQEALAGKAVKKVIVVPGRMVNIVAG